ncbi:TlpA family protein disulfide reductase [Zunongwangia sp.]|uniref:TlpA family protein disulfide reductase n=1 Tax=Zunongwangia sp. TaxID=1965325 RepID=UPI003AA9AAAC
MKLEKKLKVLPIILVVLFFSLSTINCKAQTNTGNQQQSKTINLAAPNKTKKDTLLPGITLPVIAGKTLHFRYFPKGDLKNKQNINGLAYTYQDFKWHIKDVNIEKDKGAWNCSFKIPKDCAFLAFKFYTNTENGIVTDTNTDNGYMYTPVSSEYRRMPGSSLAWGTFRNKNFNSNFGNYFKEFSASNEATEFWLKKEVKDNPGNLPKFIDTYINILKVRKPEKFAKIANKILDNFLNDFKDLSESQLITLKNIYQFELKNTKVSDSLHQVIANRYPKGIEMRSQAFMTANQLGDEANRFNKLVQFLKDFPNDNSVPKSQYFIYNKVYSVLFEHFFVKKEFDKAIDLLPAMNFVSINDSYHFTVSKAYHFKSVSTENLLKLSTPMIAELRKKNNDLSYMSGLYWSPNQATENANNELDRKLKVHIKILNDLGKYREALEAFSTLSTNQRYTDSDLNELYVSLLQQLNKDIKPVLEEAAKFNALTPHLTKLLEDEYNKEAHVNSDFNEYLAALKSANKNELTTEDLIFVKSPSLVFEDASGNSKTIMGKKDQIIILDFWANWCAPCKKSFPAMHRLSESYSENQNVQFYFVNTSENTSNYKEKAVEYFKNNSYSDSLLLFDIKSQNGPNNVTFSKFSTLFSSSGIPRKVIIKNGQIRYTSEGYSGNPSELTDEINNIIYLLENE